MFKYLLFPNNYFYKLKKDVEIFNSYAINGFIRKLYDLFSRNNGRI